MVREARIPAPSVKRGYWAVVKEFRDTHDLDQLDIDEAIEGVRDPRPGREPRLVDEPKE